MPRTSSKDPNPGSMIRDPVLFWPLGIWNPDPGSWIREGKKSRSGMNIWILFLRTYYQILGVKILKFFDADTDPGSCQPWIRDGKKSDPG